MKIEGTVRWIPPRSTNTEHTKYEGIFTAIGTEQEIIDFQKYVFEYVPNQSFNRNADKTPASG